MVVEEVGFYVDRHKVRGGRVSLVSGKYVMAQHGGEKSTGRCVCMCASV